MASLFQVPQPSLGLMGRQRDTRNRMPQGLGMGLQGLMPPPADAIDEAMMARRAEEEALIAAQQQPRQRDRVSGWRILDRVLGGQTVTEGLDAERGRLQAMADQPRAQAIAMENERIARAMGPQALLALRLNGEQLGSQVSRQFAPMAAAEGTSIVTPGNPGQAFHNEHRVVAGDRVIGMGAGGEGPRDLMTIDPSYQDQTARLTAERPVELAPGAVALNRDGTAFGRGADRILSAADGVDVLTEAGRPIYQNTRDAPVADPVAAEAARRAAAAGEESRRAMAANLATGLAGARQFVGSAGVWSQYNPLNRQARANLEGHLDTLKGNITFERLTEMKRNSPNGASGLGALSDNEARMLASTVAALNPDMSPEQLRRSFEVIDGLIAKLQAPAPGGSAPQGGPVTVQTPEQAQALDPGTRYRNPAGQEFVR